KGSSESAGSAGHRDLPLTPSGALPRMSPIEFRAGLSGRAQVSEGVATRGRPSVRPWLIAIVVIGTGLISFRIVRSHNQTTAPGDVDSYEIACRSCQARFQMPVREFRSALASRSNRNANRIRCPKCGTDDAAYRTQSGMDGQGELGPDGAPA